MSRQFLIRLQEPQSQGLEALLAILENLFPVKFSHSRERLPGVSGELLSANQIAPAERNEVSVGSFTVPPTRNISKKDEMVEISVRFSDDPNVPLPFRGRSIRTKVSGQPKLLSLRPGEQPLAVCDLGPVWVSSKREDLEHFRSAFSLPLISADGSLHDVLKGDRFLETLPLVHWLRKICVGFPQNGYRPRACFIFDDPNLHWPHYGYVDYGQLAARAEKENYHVAFATIPLDTWFTHSGTAGIFRKYRSRVSLLIHGNNHSKRELARRYTESERILLLRQAIQRVEGLERRSGLAVSRIMVPPHGACSEEMLAALPVYGFEAACISHGSLRAHNKSSPWTKKLGYFPFELIRGCPVFPRWGITGNLTNTILLAAYLNQAIVLRGHHQDLKDGPELLDELARFVNGLGPTTWTNMTDIVRSSYVASSANDQQITDAANGSPLKQPFAELVGLETATSASSQVARKQAARMRMHSKTSVSIWFIRRLLTEGRDRFLSTR